MRSGRPPAGKAYRGVRRARRRPPRTRIATRIAALLRVDLGLLQLARKVHVDRLPLREHIDPGDPRLAVAVPRVLHAPERKMDFRPDRRRVDVEEPRLEVAHRREGLVDVARVDR